MTRKERRREINRQTKRLYKILQFPERDTVEKEVVDCIQKGADLQRRNIPFGLPIWFGILMKHRPAVIKILYDYGGLGEDIVIQNHWRFDKNDNLMNVNYTLEWVISETFYKLTYPEEWKDDDMYEFAIQNIESRKKIYDEYKKIFEIQKFDLDLCRKKGLYN